MKTTSKIRQLKNENSLKSEEYVMLKTASDLSLYVSSWDANGGEIFVWWLVPPVAIAAAYILVLEKDNRGDCDTLGPSKYRYYVLHLSKGPFLKNGSDLMSMSGKN